MDLAQPLTEVKGIGPKTAAALESAGLVTVRDLLYLLPRDYDNYTAATTIGAIRPGKVTIRARIESTNTRYVRAHLSITEAVLTDGQDKVRAVWFNQPYRARQLATDKDYYFSGEYLFSRERYQLQNPSSTLVSDASAVTSGIQPTYPVRGGIKSSQLRKAIESLRDFITEIPDLHPLLAGRADAIYSLHFPDSEAEITAARAFLATEELFCFILASQLNREHISQLSAKPAPTDLDTIRQFIASLPFTPTDAQRRVAWDILQDTNKPTPMNRLLQGDVGSGKTLVAAIAALNTARSHQQTAILAPTEILATQHAESLSKLLTSHDVNIALLTGSTKHRRELKSHIKNGEVDIIVGTHALLTDDTEFHQLGLVVIDEQHRFGVSQRQKLIAKSPAHTSPHLLAMTATPIPRTLQLTLFGDLDISIIDQMPAGRTPIKTDVVTPQTTEEMWAHIKSEIANHHQIYYICKAIEQNDASELKNIETEYGRVQKRLPGARVAMLHGRMKASDKDDIMRQFVAGAIDIVVSTTVVEVGVDNPNATIIAIENADRYGLAQLHQLRGRVGRGQHPSACYLIATDGTEPGKRLAEVARTNDGFRLAEIDLELRGPGEIYGSLQHGVLDLQIAKLSDTRSISRAQKLVSEFVKTGQKVLEYKELAGFVRKYQKLTTLN
jgi:ATP-dependent DNA helicase RecG